MLSVRRIRGPCCTFRAVDLVRLRSCCPLHIVLCDLSCSCCFVHVSLFVLLLFAVGYPIRLVMFVMCLLSAVLFVYPCSFLLLSSLGRPVRLVSFVL